MHHYGVRYYWFGCERGILGLTLAEAKEKYASIKGSAFLGCPAENVRIIWEVDNRYLPL